MAAGMMNTQPAIAKGVPNCGTILPVMAKTAASSICVAQARLMAILGCMNMLVCQIDCLKPHLENSAQKGSSTMGDKETSHRAATSRRPMVGHQESTSGGAPIARSKIVTRKKIQLNTSIQAGRLKVSL